jgi:hypothetical protein
VRIPVVILFPDDAAEAIAERAAMMLERECQHARSRESPPEVEPLFSICRDRGNATAADLADRDCASQPEIGRAVRARDAVAREQLRGDPCFQLRDRCRSRPRRGPS